MKYKIGDGIGTNLMGGVPSTNSTYGIIVEIIDNDTVKIKLPNSYTSDVQIREFSKMNDKETKIRFND